MTNSYGYPVKKAKEEKANASHGQGIGFSLLTRIRVAPTDIIGFIPTDFYSRVWVRVRVSSCGFFRFGFLFVDSLKSGSIKMESLRVKINKIDDTRNKNICLLYHNVRQLQALPYPWVIAYH